MPAFSNICNPIIIIIFSVFQIRGVRESRDALTRQRKEALEDKLQRAEKMRESHLQEIVRKAQEEEAKVYILLLTYLLH